MGEGWQRVAALEEVPDGGCLAVDHAGHPVVLVRTGEQVRALENVCPHAGAPLSEGFLEDGKLTCAWHGWTFDVQSGRSCDGAGMAVPVHEVKVEDGQVFLRE